MPTCSCHDPKSPGHRPAVSRSPQRASALTLTQLPPPGAPLLCGPSMLQQHMPPHFKPSGLDNLLCYGHYVVHQVRTRRVGVSTLLCTSREGKRRGCATCKCWLLLTCPGPALATCRNPCALSSWAFMLNTPPPCFPSQSAPYLDREQHARDYRAHLVIFTARAHLADERVGAAGVGALGVSLFGGVVRRKGRG